MLKIEPLKLYFFRASHPIKGMILEDFGLQYSTDALYQELQTKVDPLISLEVFGEIEMSKILQLMETSYPNIKIPTKLKKREFINNLRYTKDSLIKDDERRLQLESILNTI